jgi:hypothetical protein
MNFFASGPRNPLNKPFQSGGNFVDRQSRQSPYFNKLKSAVDAKEFNTSLCGSSINFETKTKPKFGVRHDEIKDEPFQLNSSDEENSAKKLTNSETLGILSPSVTIY